MLEKRGQLMLVVVVVIAIAVIVVGNLFVNFSFDRDKSFDSSNDDLNDLSTGNEFEEEDAGSTTQVVQTNDEAEGGTTTTETIETIENGGTSTVVQNAEAKAVADKYLVKNDDGSVGVGTQIFVDTNSMFKDEFVSIKMNLKVGDMDKLPAGISSVEEFLNILINQGNVQFDLSFVDSDVKRIDVIENLEADDSPAGVISLVEENVGANDALIGNTLMFKLLGGEPTVTYSGKENPSINLEGKEEDILSYMRKSMSSPPKSYSGTTTHPLVFGQIKYETIPQYQKDGERIEVIPIEVFFSYYLDLQK